MLAIELISESVLPIELNETGEQALKMMEAFKLSDLPVIEDERLHGVISESFIYDNNEPGAKIYDMGRLPSIYVMSGQHCFDVIQTLSISRATSVPVIDETSKYLGTITIHEVIPGLSKIFSLQQPGGVIVLQMNKRDYSLSEISQIVESNDAKILSLYVNPSIGGDIEITFRISKIEIGSTIQAFERYGYEVKEYYSEEMESGELYKDRYDLLMKYLNI